MTDPIAGRRLQPMPFVHYRNLPHQNSPPRDDKLEQTPKQFREHLYGPKDEQLASTSSEPSDRHARSIYEHFPHTPPSVMDLLAKQHRAVYGAQGKQSVCTAEKPSNQAAPNPDAPVPNSLLEATDPLAERRRALYLDLAQTSLDLIGIVDPSPVSDLTGAGLSALRGDGMGVLIAIAGIVPYVGDLAKLGKLPKLAHIIEESIELSKLDTKFRQSACPILQKLQTAMDGAAQLSFLPASAQRRLNELSQQLDVFLRQTPEQLAASAKPNPNREAQLTVKGLLEPDTLHIAELSNIEQWEGIRNKFLKKWRDIDVSAFPPETQRLLQGSADKVIRKNMKPDDLAAILKENRGVKIIKPDGEFYEHKKEFNQAREAILKIIGGKGSHQRPGLKDRSSTLAADGRTHTLEYQLLQERLSDLSNLLGAYKSLQKVEQPK